MRVIIGLSAVLGLSVAAATAGSIGCGSAKQGASAGEDGGGPEASASDAQGASDVALDRASEAGMPGVGADGGTVSSLLFTVVGDTRPASSDDTSGYPTSIIEKIYADVAALNPAPLFTVSTGDYMFASTYNGQAGAQLDLYLHARAQFPGAFFPAMGNHECTGGTASNCGQGNQNGLTDNYNQFLGKMLGPIQKTKPYYSVEIDATDGSWTSKFVFIAANAWDSGQASWLQQTLGQATTYTFVMRHESSQANTAPGVDPSDQIIGQHPYTLLIVGHSHTYDHPNAKVVLFGNGGAPLSSGNYGYGLFSQRKDGAIVVDAMDYMSNQADSSFHFVVKPDGSATN